MARHAAGRDAVAEFVAGLEPAKRDQVQALLDAIRSAEVELTEHIKWNAPSFIFDGTDRVTLNVVNRDGLVKVILHMGTERVEDKKAPPIMADDSGLLTWHSDARASMTFHDLEEIEARNEDIVHTVVRWLKIT